MAQEAKKGFLYLYLYLFLSLYHLFLLRSAFVKKHLLFLLFPASRFLSWADTDTETDTDTEKGIDISTPYPLKGGQQVLGRPPCLPASLRFRQVSAYFWASLSICPVMKGPVF